ncbi:arginine decarboxylase [Klebsormidium nitens]|uniref:Arginine decarboxylase n=1 Tax=Klebsormidium nitens TaxID=105231 RepID=A0A1Y1IJC1_KLENI|nr:arginine decarboxylase [Klebsormidium nitens]|eukprot:GAQ88816.1 arginine decarboxylase [Klebsormidium nitens]
MACTTFQVTSTNLGSALASRKHCCLRPSSQVSSAIAGAFPEVRRLHDKTRAGSSWAQKYAVSLGERKGLERQHISKQRWRIRVHSGVASRSSESNGVATPERLPSAAILDQDGDLDEDWEAAWTPQDAADLYRVEGWGSPYFSINARGNVAIRPKGSEDGSDELDLLELIQAVRKRNVELPMILRFPDIVQHRMAQLQGCFDTAIGKYGYQGHFQGVFPVKCNHDRYLIEDIVEYGRNFRFGLEAGSKPELLIAIANLRENDDALLVCNGYKDEIYMESVLLARQLGTNAVIVLEQVDELPLLLHVSRKLDVRPVIGVRAKLSTKHDGHWGGTSGDKGKFGLTIPEIVKVVYTLREEGMLDCLQLLHYHVGSQVADIAIIKEAMREGSHLYCELATMGAAMGYIDVGGGLGIDYDGTKGNRSGASTNYSMQNYANDVVAALLDACVVKGVRQPVIASESGRALASHSAVLVFDVLNDSENAESDALRNLAVLEEHHAAGLGSIQQGWPPKQDGLATNGLQPARRDPGQYLLSTFYQVFATIDQTNFQEAFNDSKQFKQEAANLFKLGCLSLEQRAQAESLHTAICHRVLAYARNEPQMPAELSALSEAMASVYHVNLSVFRSAVDTWAIDQLFPIMPLQRLSEEPTTMATLADLTCDSDGKITRFIGPDSTPSSVLPVHELRQGEAYYLGMFLGGVYQEVMGSLHNLFGGLNVVHIRAKPKPGRAAGGYAIEHVVKGQTMEEVLRTVQYEGEDMMESLRNEAEEAVDEGRLTLEDASALLMNFNRSLKSYTYLKSRSQ